MLGLDCFCAPDLLLRHFSLIAIITMASLKSGQVPEAVWLLETAAQCQQGVS